MTVLFLVHIRHNDPSKSLHYVLLRKRNKTEQNMKMTSHRKL